MNDDDIRRLLPWYAAGTLAADEAAAVEAGVRRSPELQRELREWQLIGGAAVAPSPAEPEFRPAFGATWARVEAHERERRAATPRAPRATLPGWLRATWFALPVAGRWALAAQFALIVALAGLLELTPREPATFTTLSAPGPAATHRGARLSVTFEPTASEAELRALLGAVGAQVVAGPTAEQAYTLELSDRSATAADTALGRLRAAHGVVRFAARAGE